VRQQGALTANLPRAPPPLASGDRPRYLGEVGAVAGPLREPMGGGRAPAHKARGVIFQLNNSGFQEEVTIPDRDVKDVHRRLLDRFLKCGDAERTIVILAGPPACGKGVLCALWGHLAAEAGVSYVAVSQDGFHFPNAYLAERGLLAVKGSPDTFDARGMTIAMAQLAAGTPVVWPTYDRTIHEPRPDGPSVNGQRLVVVEGNYLLLDEPHWASVRRHGHLSVRIEVDTSVLRKRLVARHVRGGLSQAQAEAKFSSSDLNNIIEVNERSVQADVALLRKADGGFQLLRGGERTL